MVEPTPLKNDGVRHLGWWNSIPNINGKSFQIPWFQSPPTRYNQLIFWSQICVNPHPLGVFQMKRMGSKESRKYQRSQDNNCRRRLSRFNDGSNARRFLLKKTVAKTKSKAKCCCFAMKILLISSYIILYRYIYIYIYIYLDMTWQLELAWISHQSSITIGWFLNIKQHVGAAKTSEAWCVEPWNNLERCGEILPFVEASNVDIWQCVKTLYPWWTSK